MHSWTAGGLNCDKEGNRRTEKSNSDFESIRCVGRCQVRLNVLTNTDTNITAGTCSLFGIGGRFRGTYCLKRRLVSARLYGTTSHERPIFKCWWVSVDWRRNYMHCSNSDPPLQVTSSDWWVICYVPGTVRVYVVYFWRMFYLLFHFMYYLRLLHGSSLMLFL